ncbi:hypothetical protein BATDEDRAFT_23019 [Batrachochytrium dendrobatidis JAM81]|uniref:Lysosomal dipeptide transporter MFSD1 n=1 Tax=Batrachochytrium dendrobatidis (strain JAM81 / FGSC 10211) TaxID=684364 RepID=F4NWH4_BATDJ|nr:uncharacterized protein BATDEDRAFT_23019 [Batrachochytrium dendrobatidis JAM81]EGF82830.1 hypothetical protein BATDEDRAFT_23019 [Batrachochytrium dendrobatidis JAM81]|eukprot:XP_006676685.1 hypothetical protein BATDEDRAFT_23019 [Batrachochytrium dendrobatidis JAM81]
MDKKKYLHWVVLALSCLMVFGNYYCYDLPSALNIPMYNYLNIDYITYQFQLNLLYSVYSFPNIILPLFAGVLVDKYPTSYMVIVFSLMVCIGQSIFAIGVTTKNFIVMATGRLIFGIGGESLEVASASIITQWFEGRLTGLAFALGMNLASARLATAVNANLSPWIANRDGVQGAVWVGLSVSCISLLCAIGLGYICHRMDRFTLDHGSDLDMSVETITNSNDTAEKTTIESKDQSKQPDVVALHPTPPKIHINTSMTTDDTTTYDATTTLDDINEDGYESEEYDEVDDQVHIEHVWRFGPSFWLLFLTTVFIYGSILPFFHVCTDFMSIPDIISAIGSPLSGIFIDNFGHRSTLLPISIIIIFIAHTTLAYSTFTPIAAMTLMGIAYSFFASSLWPCVPFLVGQHQIATAYGFLTSALNISLFIFPLILAKIRSVGDRDDFMGMQWFFMGLCGVAFISSLGLGIWDWVYGHGSLQQPSIQPKHSKDKTISSLDAGETQDNSISDSANTLDDSEAGISTVQSIAHTTASSLSTHNVAKRRSALIEAQPPSPTKVYKAQAVGVGLVVSTPSTVVHHHHHVPYARSARARSPERRGSSSAVDPTSPSTTMLAHTNCKCHESNGMYIQEEMDPFEFIHASAVITERTQDSESGSSQSASPVRGMQTGDLLSPSNGYRLPRSTSPVRRTHFTSSKLSESSAEC